MTSTLKIGTGVTCPTIRIHPAIIAQAAATVASMMPGRFMLGLGSGENLNEHILGNHWPPADARLEMLEEAVDVIRLLWRGGQQSHYGKHYHVWIHQAGPDQNGFFKFYEQEVLPRLSRALAASSNGD